jgi:ATP-binding cassette subfamily B (MDR/TAP) protein 1
MLSHGFKRSKYNSCVYIKYVNGSPIYLLLYVDDMLIAAKSRKEITTLKKLLSSEFEMKDLCVANKILGMDITRDRKAGLFSLS